MRQTISQKCPLCATDAVFYYVDYEERKYFKCPNCTKFQITRRAESRLDQAPEQWKEELAKRAKNSPTEHLLVISAPTPTAEVGQTTEALTSEFVPKSELLL